MSVIITNVSTHDDTTGPNDYIVRINNGPVLGEFSHIRGDGLAECLRRAADAVDKVDQDREWISTPPPNSPEVISVRHEWSYRWLPYKAKSEQRKKGIMGRWQRATEYGWENCAAPDGMEWRRPVAKGTE